MKVKVCNVCGTTHNLVPTRQNGDGLRPLCKPCKNAKQAASRQARLLKAAELAAVAAEVARAERQRPDGLVPARTFVSTTVWDGDLGPAYYRNKGNTHIKSRGVMC